MKEEKPSLVLNKKVVAHLNNLEMHHVRGGDGGDCDVTRTGCGNETDVKTTVVLEDAGKILLSLILKVC